MHVVFREEGTAFEEKIINCGLIHGSWKTLGGAEADGERIRPRLNRFVRPVRRFLRQNTGFVFNAIPLQFPANSTQSRAVGRAG